MTFIFPSISKLFEEKQCRLERFDAVFHDTAVAAGDGYFIISGKGDEVYLFVVGGKPYASGRIEQDGFSFLDVQEFFDAYSDIAAGDLSFCKTEKKLLLSILVYFRKQPSQKFTADMVDMEKVLKELETKGADSLIVTRCGDKMGFSICLKGRPSFNFMPDGAYAQEQPRDGLLLYILGETSCTPSIEIFTDIQMTPATDAIPPKAEMPKSLTAHYTKKASAPTTVSGAGLTLMLDNKVINKYPLIKIETTIGRSAGSDILLENPGVSRRHAVIREKDGRFIIEDKGSSNGTFIKGERITSRELKDNDQVQILNYILTLKCPQSAAEEKTVYMEPSAAQAKKTGAAKLMLEDGRDFPLKSTVITIGSGEDMGLRLEGRGVAEHHASILRGKQGEFTLVHKGGRMDTKVNGQKIGEHNLKNNDTIEIGNYKISYQVS